MNVEVLQEKFAKALLHINKAVSTRPNIPVLSNVLLHADNGKLYMSSTNLEVGINTHIGAEVSDFGKTTVSARLLSEFVNSLKPGKIKLYIDSQNLIVETPENKAEFQVIPADEFPSVPKIQGDPLVCAKAKNFALALDKTTFASATDNSRPVLTGILMRITKRKLMMVSVDGYRLSQKFLDIENGPENDFKEIVPAKALAEVGKIITDVASQEDEIKIYSLDNQNQLIFKIDDVELATRLIDGQFPAFDDILPKDKIYSFSVLKSDLQDVVKIVNIFARNVVGNKTRFFVDTMHKKLRLSAEVADMGKNATSVDITNIVGSDLETAFSGKYMQDMINSMTSDEIIFESNGVTAPGVFRDKTDEDYVHVIMPMRTE